MAKSITRVVPLTEKLIGVAIIALLFAIGSLIYLKGKNYDPSLYQVNEASLSSTTEVISSKQSTIAEDTTDLEEADEFFEEDYSDYEEGYEEVEVNTNSFVLSNSSPLPNVSPLSELEHYVSDTLYEKINGRAPAYIGFNFQQLTCRTFASEEIPGQYLDVFIYEMDTPVNAFGIYSMEKEPNAQPATFVEQGYRSEMGFFFRWANNYIQVIASDTSDKVMSLAEELSISLTLQITADDTGVGAAAILPFENQIPGSLSYIQSYAYGIESLNDVFEAQYEVDGVQFPFFAMKTSPDKSLIAMEDVAQFFRDYGTIIEERSEGEVKIIVGESFELYSMIYQIKDELGGVMNAEDLEIIKAFVDNHLSNQNQ